MSVMRALLIALSTYTRLPLPHADFQEQDMKYSMCFLPLAGVLTGLLFWGWAHLASSLNAGSLMRAAGFVLLPLLMTGGIHMDGYLDVCDALASWQPKEKKLDIMKDPHMGAFAVIHGSMYLLALLGIYGEMASPRQALLVAVGFVLSRCLAVFLLNLLPNARGSGMLQRFQQAQSKKAALMSALGFSMLAVLAGFLLSPMPFLLGLGALALTALWFHSFARRKFGGITGDLAGFFIQMAELVFALVAVILGRLA